MGHASAGCPTAGGRRWPQVLADNYCLFRHNQEREQTPASEAEAAMTNSIQSVAVASRPGQAPQPERNTNLFSSENRQMTEKTEDTFFIPSLFSGFHLFNMLIINRLNSAKIKNPAKDGKNRRYVLHTFAFSRFSFIQHACYQ
jgi:hypothetical protein